MSNIIGFSKGLYSSWFYHAPSRSLFDCGEGCASFLGNKVNAVQNIFISHDHNDHIAGLLTFIAARGSGQTAFITDPNDPNNEIGKPLNIYYPLGNINIERLLNYVVTTGPKLPFQLAWIPVEDGEIINDNIQAFQTQHYYRLSLGYKILETRKRLKPAFKDQNIAALIRSKTVDRANINEEYVANAFVYSLDSNANLNQKDYYGADVWVADTTFLTPHDRTGGNTHGSIVEIVQLADNARVKNLICAHLSPRYDPSRITKEIVETQRVYPHMNIKCVDYTKIFNF